MSDWWKLWQQILKQTREGMAPCLKNDFLPDFERDHINPAIGSYTSKTDPTLILECMKKRCDFSCRYIIETDNGIVNRIQRVDNGECRIESRSREWGG